jgi:hypothetical protein
MLFTSMGWSFVSELRPPTGLLSIPQMIYEYQELQWNDIDREKPNNSEKTLLKYHFVRKSHVNWPGRKPGPPRLEACDYPPETGHCSLSMLM